MAWDLALDENGDLIFGANRDLLPVTGLELTEQRMRVRLLLPQGTATYDTTSSVGSELRGILRRPLTEISYQELVVRVQEALAPMDDIIVSDVEINSEGTAVSVNVIFQHVADDDNLFLADGSPEEVIQIQL